MNPFHFFYNEKKVDVGCGVHFNMFAKRWGGLSESMSHYDLHKPAMAKLSVTLSLTAQKGAPYIHSGPG